MSIVIGNKYTRAVSFLLLFGMMCIIFVLSCESAENSTDTSASVIDLIANLLRIELYSEKYWALTTLIRKLAHFSEFGLLGIFALLSAAHFKLRPIHTFALPALFSVVYAISDELHQYFVPGRACRVLDVCIDSAGALFGISITLWLICRILRRKNNETVTFR